jgi:hypothetical protein
MENIWRTWRTGEQNEHEWSDGMNRVQPAVQEEAF